MNRLAPIMIFFCLAIPGDAWGQQYIGEHKSDVRKLMKENWKELYEDKSSRNPVYNMVKYVNRLGTQTLIYFFSEQDTCTLSKWMCDYSMLNKVISDLNEKYKQSAENTWHYTHENRDYRITLTTGDWFFTIVTKPEVKE